MKMIFLNQYNFFYIYYHLEINSYLNKKLLEVQKVNFVFETLYTKDKK